VNEEDVHAQIRQRVNTKFLIETRTTEAYLVLWTDRCMDFYSNAQLNTAPTLIRTACIYLTTHGTTGIRPQIVMKDTSTPKTLYIELC
jgi:hypothetical protein